MKTEESCEDVSVYEATGCHLSDADNQSCWRQFS